MFGNRNNRDNGNNTNRRFNLRKYLVLEPHIDDFEIAMSIWLKKQSLYPTEVTIVTFCNGRENKDAVIRQRKREDNIKAFKKLYPEIEIKNINLGFTDTKLDAMSMSQIIDEFYKNMKDFNIQEYKEIYIPQEDLHTDHSIINRIGKIFTRPYKGKVFEFIIQNSREFGNYGITNTEIRSEFTFGSQVDNDKYIYPCMFDGEKNQSYQYILYRQKWYDGKFISDKFNLIKDTFVVGE